MWLHNMYNNIGRKIKGLAKGLFIIESVVAVIIALVLMARSVKAGFRFLVVGVPVIACLAWISSWVLYGFGAMVEKIVDEDGIMPVSGNYVQNPMPASKPDSKGMDKINKLFAQGLLKEEAYREIVNARQEEEKKDEQFHAAEQELTLLKEKVEQGLISEEEYKAQCAEIIKKFGLEQE